MYQLEELLPVYLLKEIIIYFIYFLFLTVFILLIILIVHKLHKERIDHKKKNYIKRYKDMIKQYLKDGSLAQNPDTNLEYEAFAEASIDILSDSRGPLEDKIKNLLKETSTVEHYKKIASSSSWIKRFFAIEKLGFFRMEDLKDFFTEIIHKDRSPEVRAKALWALSFIADGEALDFITQVLASKGSESSKFNEYIYTNIIRSFKKKNLIPILIGFLNEVKEDESVPVVIKRDLIEACGSESLSEAADIISVYFSRYSHDVRMRIACIRALGRIGEPASCNVVMRGLLDNEWRVRAVSAKAASICTPDKVIPEIQRLLYDPVFFVRINAAWTLALLGKKGLSVLKNELDSHDSFVRDTARNILEEAGINV
jgi:HEAT repeat protein